MMPPRKSQVATVLNCKGLGEVYEGRPDKRRKRAAGMKHPAAVRALAFK